MFHSTVRGIPFLNTGLNTRALELDSCTVQATKSATAFDTRTTYFELYKRERERETEREREEGSQARARWPRELVPPREAAQEGGRSRGVADHRDVAVQTN